MRIYTRQGDEGETSLRQGKRVRKDDARVEAYGTVDETNAFVGLALALLPAAPAGGHEADVARLRACLTRVQRELFEVGADLATPPDAARGESPRVGAEHAAALERDVDEMEEGLAPLKQFILPGGSPAAAALHAARAVCRRAERRVVALAAHDPLDPALLVYLNRLSDFLFVAARAANRAAGVADVPWQPLTR